MSRILIVDDEKGITNPLKIGLEDLGFRVDSYNDPEEALSKYEPNRYELIIVDIRMPQMNGFDLFRELKKIDSNAKVCFLTAFDVYEGEFQKLFPDMKVEGFIKKPITISGLASEIKKITG
jgi:two-component system catabolic regulation response regulator CreB/two-component system response regulator ChvI